MKRRKQTMASVWRQARGATSQSAWATKLGVTQAYISLIESGTRTSVSVSLLKTVAKITGLSIEHLLGG